MAKFDTFTVCVNHVNRDRMVSLPDLFSGSTLSFLGDASLSLSELDLSTDLTPVLDFALGRPGRSSVGPSVWPKLLQESSSGLLGLG